MSDHVNPDLLSVAQAIRIIDDSPVVARIARVPLDQSAGLRLAEDLTADRDYPPFRKSQMDGYAVRSADVAGGAASLRVIDQIAAGQWPQRAIGPGETMAIMTGAPVPDGADGVVPVEDVEARVPVGGIVRVLRAKAPQRFIAARGSDCPAGRTVLTRGTLIGPAQIAVAASIGAAQLSCFTRPRVAVLGTGDELVPLGQTPGPAQIRDSNTPMLTALLRRLGCDVVDIATVRDEPELIRNAIRRGMAHDALFITGGMSMGEFDYVPRLLAELGVELKITKLRMKPGKPFVFGIGRGEGGTDEETERQREGETEGHKDDAVSVSPSPAPSFIFGLPGNPVSAFVCTLRLASRLLTRLAGGTVEERWIIGRLDTSLSANGPREFYQPAMWTMARGDQSAQIEHPTIKPLAWKGSADLFTLAAANALIVRGENEVELPGGAMIRVLEI
jgi:molybdopterin molybdotransferase